MKLNKGQKIAIGIFAAALYIFFILWPLMKAATKGSGEVKKLKKEVQTTESDIANMGKLKEKLDQLKKDVDDFEARLVKEENINLLLEELSRMATQSQVKIQGIKPQKPEFQSGAIYGEFPVIVEAKGGYHSLGAFVNKLEYSKYFLSVKDIKMEFDPDNPTSHNCRLTIAAYTSVEQK